MADNSQTLNWTGQTAAVAVTSSAPYCDTIVILNESGQILYARADGVTAVSQAAGTIYIPSGATAVLANGLPLPNANTGVYTTGPSNDKSQSEAVAWTAQTGYTTAGAPGIYPTAPNYLSIIPFASATGTVTITFQ